MIRELTEAEVAFDVECHDETLPIRGNCSAIDAVVDRKAEQWIRNQLRQGNAWAWCSVKVAAKWKGYEGEDWLWCCSYKGETDFCQPGGYFDDMKAEALANLNSELARHAEDLEELRTVGATP